MCLFAQETCKKLHALIDKLDEERYDLEIKVGKADKEVHFHLFCRTDWQLFTSTERVNLEITQCDIVVNKTGRQVVLSPSFLHKICTRVKASSTKVHCNNQVGKIGVGLLY